MMNFATRKMKLFNGKARKIAMVVLCVYTIGWLLFLVGSYWLLATPKTETQSNSESYTTTDAAYLVPHFLVLVTGPIVCLLGALYAALPGRRGRVPQVMSGFINVMLIGALSIVAVENGTRISEANEAESVWNGSETYNVELFNMVVADPVPILLLSATLIQGLCLLLVMLSSKFYSMDPSTLSKEKALIFMMSSVVFFFGGWLCSALISGDPCYSWWPSFLPTVATAIPISFLIFINQFLCSCLERHRMVDIVINLIIAVPIVIHMVFVSVSLSMFPHTVRFDSECYTINFHATIAFAVINYVSTCWMLYAWLFYNYTSIKKEERRAASSTPRSDDVEQGSTSNTPTRAGEPVELNEVLAPSTAAETVEHEEEDVFMTSDTQPLTERGEDQEQSLSPGTLAMVDEPAELREASPSVMVDETAEYEEDVIMTGDTQLLINDA